MADFLSNGVSALLAFQRALDVTSQNISNVGTDGYSRQRANFVTNPAQPFGNGWVGSGVNVDTVTRSYDNFLAGQVRTSSSSFERSDTFATFAARVDNMFGNSTTGLSATLQKFVSATQDVANSPASTAPRQVMLSTAQAVAAQMQAYDNQLSGLAGEVKSRMGTEVSDINTLAQGIAKLNQEIKTGYATTGQPPNDLLDQRDKLLDQLSGHINVNVSDAGGGVVNVSVGNGQPLVNGNQANSLVAKQDAFDPSRSYIAIQAGSTGAVDITSNLSGGTLGGLLDFRNQVLDPARNTLGRISVGIADVVNTQQKAGMDLNGAQGANMFNVGGVQALPNFKNTGTGTLAITRVNTGALTDSDYVLQKTATGWSLRNSSTGTAVTMTGTGTSADPLMADGLSIVTGGTAATGDQFLVQPTRGATAGLTVAFTNPAQIAAASPVKSGAATANTGTGTISAPKVTNSANAQLRAPVSITFLSASTYSINGGPAVPYTNGATIQQNGWSATISGTPATGDTFTVGDNAGGTGDNSNALNLAAVFDTKILNGGADSVNAALGRFIGDIGVSTQQAQNSADAQQSVYNANLSSRDSVSGVSLDEEAANLLRFQQAYQAAAQLIGVAKSLFDTLIASTRG